MPCQNERPADVHAIDRARRALGSEPRRPRDRVDRRLSRGLAVRVLLWASSKARTMVARVCGAPSGATHQPAPTPHWHLGASAAVRRGLAARRRGSPPRLAPAARPAYRTIPVICTSREHSAAMRRQMFPRTSRWQEPQPAIARSTLRSCGVARQRVDESPGEVHLAETDPAGRSDHRQVSTRMIRRGVTRWADPYRAAPPMRAPRNGNAGHEPGVGEWRGTGRYGSRPNQTAERPAPTMTSRSPAPTRANVTSCVSWV